MIFDHDIDGRLLGNLIVRAGDGMDDEREQRTLRSVLNDRRIERREIQLEENENYSTRYG